VSERFREIFGHHHSTARHWGTFPMLYVAVTEIWRSMHENAARRIQIQLPHHHHSPHPKATPFRYTATSRELFWGIPELFSLRCPVKSRYLCPSFVLIWKRSNLGRLAAAGFV
jgi:hypothetical protein